jgi:hypothetical protein
MSGQSLFLKRTENEGRSAQVDRFLAARGAGSGRLVFALDATASRLPLWGMARELTAGMIREAASIGTLNLQLVYFRGGVDSPPECVASQWTSDSARLAATMARVECRAGYTQIARILRHAQHETLEAKVGAVVFIGDACESENDDLDKLAAPATALGRLKTPVFAFQEGKDPGTEKAFRKLAEWSGGAYGRFDAGAARELGDLLRAAAAFAMGGVQALEGRKDAGARLLLGQLKGDA